MGDSQEYIYEAINIKEHFFFYSGNPAMNIVPELMTQRQPLYPLFLMLVYIFSINNWIVIVLQNLLSIFNIIYCRGFFKKFGYQNKYDWLLLLFLITYPAQSINANTIAPDILLQFFTLLYFGGIILLLKENNTKGIIVSSIALTLGMFVKPVLYPLTYLHIIIIIIVILRKKVKFSKQFLISVVPLCIMLSYSFWNFNRTGKFHFSSNQAFNAIYYYYPFLSNRYGIDSADAFLYRKRQELSRIREYKERYNQANRIGFRMLIENFVSYTFYHLKNSLRIFIEPGKAEFDLFTGKLTYGQLYRKEQRGFYSSIKASGFAGITEYIKNNPSVFVILIVGTFNILKVLGVILFFRFGSISLQKPLILFFFVYFSVLAGPISNTRYFLPVSLIWIMCSAIGYTVYLTNKKTKTGIFFNKYHI